MNTVLFVGYLNGENIPVHVNIQSTPLNTHIHFPFFGIDAHVAMAINPRDSYLMVLLLGTRTQTHTPNYLTNAPYIS